MSATAGAGGMQSGGIMDLVRGFLMGGQAPGTVVGQENPEWEFPYGAERVPDDVRSIFLRSDAGPTGLNEFIQQEMKKNPAIIDRLRSMINMGIMRPKNAAAQNIVTGYGGYRAGDMTPLGPLINGMPSGLNESQLNTLANIIGSGIQYNLGLIEQSGYLNGVPTLERDNIMGQLAQGWMSQAIDQFRANEESTHNRATEGLDQQRITNDNIQKMATIFGGSMQTDPATGQQTFQPTEEARQFNTEQSGYLDGQATLTREQQAFNQAKDVAALASNPRNYIEAQMLAGSRGGLNGMAPNNQIAQTTFGPPTTVQQPQFLSPGGPNQQMQNLQTMQTGIEPWQGTTPEQQAQRRALLQQPTAPGGQQGQGFNTPTPQGQAATPQMNLSNPQQWSDMLTQAGGQWGTAQNGLNAVRSNPAWGGFMPPGGGPSQVGAGPAPWPGTPSGFGNLSSMRSGVQPAGQMAQQPQQFATSNFTQSLLQNRVVPKSGGMSTAGQYMTADQMQSGFNPNKIRTQDYLRGERSQQQGFNAVGSMAGYSDEDLQGIMQKNLPSFRSPTAGKMI